MGLQQRSGDGPPANSAPNAEWLIRTDTDGARKLAFQALQALPRVTWPYASGVTEQLHLNLTAPDKEALENQRDCVLELGAEQLLDRTDEPEEPLHVFADPTGHPFCVFITWAHPSRTPGCAQRSGPPTTAAAGCGDPKPTMAGSKPAAGRRRRHRNRWWDGTWKPLREIADGTALTPPQALRRPRGHRRKSKFGHRRHRFVPLPPPGPPRALRSSAAPG
ncbi:VOC family protein [Kocuria rosea]|uniref:VOC family protein n=1 Tax=Kocuria rosea TaxID=1275 RepID=UPI001F0E81E0|nr:VOC family protein [Kocuria rosea]